MSNFAQLADFQAAVKNSVSIDDAFGKNLIQNVNEQKITRKDALQKANSRGSDGLKITVIQPFPSKGKLIKIGVFKKKVPLLENEFAIAKEILLSDEWFAEGSNFKVIKVHIRKKSAKGSKIFIFVFASHDDGNGDVGDGGDGIKVSLPGPGQ